MRFSSANITLAVGSSQQLNIPNQAILDGKKVREIIVQPASAYSSNGVEGYGGSLASVYLKLVDKGNKAIHEALPLQQLQRQANAGQNLRLDTDQIDWTKCSLFFGNNSERNSNVGKEICLVVFYE